MTPHRSYEELVLAPAMRIVEARLRGEAVRLARGILVMHVTDGVNSIRIR